MFFCACAAGPLEATSFTVDGLRITKNVKPMKEIKRENVVTQSLDFSCGAAGLSTLLQYYHKDPIREDQIIDALLQIVPIEKVKARNGFSLYDLKKFSEAIGYTAIGYKMDYDFLAKLGKPVLVPIKFKNYRHFVIVKGVYADRVFIADPAVGNMSMKAEKFKALWTGGIGLVVEKKQGQDESNPLEVTREDLIIADYNQMRRIVDPTSIRTMLFLGEY